MPFSSPQGAVCSRNNRNNDNNNSDRPNRALRRPRPRTPAVKRVRDPSTSPEFLDSLLPPPDTLLACSVRCVAQSLEGWHERDEDEGDIENIDTDDEGDVSRVDLSVLPSDLSQRVFEDLVQTRRLTARVTGDFIGCHLTEANLRSYPGLTDDWLALNDLVIGKILFAPDATSGLHFCRHFCCKVSGIKSSGAFFGDKF